MSKHEKKSRNEAGEKKPKKKVILEDKVFDSIRKIFTSEPGKKFSFKQMKKKLTDDFKKDEIYFGIKTLTDQGVLEQRGTHYRLKADKGINVPATAETDGKAPLVPVKKENVVTGKIEITQSGYGFLVSPTREIDIKISNRHIGVAMDGDEVEVEIIPSKKGGRRLEGRVVSIVKRATDTFIGIVEVSPRFAFVVPDKKSSVHLFIPLDKLNGAKHGEKVVAKMIRWKEGEKNPTAEITKVLGVAGSNNVEMKSILLEAGFHLDFPKEVIQESEKIPTTISKEEIAKRRDFRNIFTITIDPDDAKDFDDAISLKKLENGNWEVGVHIADVSHYVKYNTALDREAEYRATSVYLVDRVLPMFPEKISNEICSLRPQEEKLTFAAVFEMDESGKIFNRWFGKTVIFSDKRFTYDEAQKAIEGNDVPFKKEIIILNELSKKLREKRFANGSINFETVEVKFKLDENAKPIGLFVKERKEAHMLIEDFMLLANKEVAEFVCKQKVNGKSIEMVYRVHDTPDMEKIETFADFARVFGHKLNLSTPKHIAHSFNKLMLDIKGKPEQNALESLAIRTMAKAVYQTENIGHYGLAFDYYTHFTSPIRRYPDVLCHRILEMTLNATYKDAPKNLVAMCNHSSEMERKAAEAERDSVKYKQVEFMQERVGEIFDAIVTGVTGWGIYLEIIETKCEGMARLESMREDHYVFDEKKMRVRGTESGNTYTLGDKVQVKVTRTNVEKKQIDLVIEAPE